MIPHQGRAVDTVNFRNVKESGSIDRNGGGGTGSAFAVGLGKSGSGSANASVSGSTGPRELKGVPLDSGLATPGGEVADPFEEFNSVTLHHDGDGEIVSGER